MKNGQNGKIKESLLQKAGRITTGNEKIDALLRRLQDYGDRTRFILFVSLLVGLLCAAYHFVIGMMTRSVWMGALGVYYAALALVRYSILRPLRARTSGADRKVYRRTAYLLNLLVLTMSGIFVQMVLHKRTYEYPGVTIYAIALWAFIKMITAVRNVIKYRKDGNLMLEAARWVSVAGALMSMLALQTALIHQFGENAEEFAFIMNAVSGAGVTGALLTIAALMIFRSKNLEKERKSASH